ncbi:MAG: ATP-binding protein [Anaerolineae bacterium]|nr:ATP-binding protein [Anaerolineae bacterium]
MIAEAILEQVIQGLSAAVWKRPELTTLREPIEAALSSGAFKDLTTRAFSAFAERSAETLPKFFDAGFITMPAVQETLSAVVVDGADADLERLAELYAKRFLKPADAPDVQKQLRGYMRQMRETFATDPTYGPLLLARDMQMMLFALNGLRGQIAEGFQGVNERLDALLKAAGTQALLIGRAGGQSAVLIKDPDDATEAPRKLIGRDALLTEVLALLEAGESVLLTGMGGMGKTALAATIAARWVTPPPAPPHVTALVERGDQNNRKVLWLKAGTQSADALFEALARPFGLAQAVAQTTGDERSALVRRILRESGVTLLLLDDCWSGAALFTLLKAVPRDLPTLISARQRHPVEGTTRDVAELARADSLALLSHHAGQDFVSPLSTSTAQWGGAGGGVASAGGEVLPAGAEALCDLLGDHAYAVEIAGKRLKADKLTPAELLAQIKDAPHDLTIPGDFSDKERASVKLLLDASVNALDADARAVFLACGAFFAPRITAEMLALYFNADAVGTESIPSVSAALATLTEQGLIDRIPAEERTIAHYALHDLTYSYAAAQNVADDRERALGTCLRYLTRYDQPSPAGHAALRPELDGLLAAATWAFSVGKWQDAQWMADQMYGRGSRILSLGGYPTLALTLIERGAAAARARGDQWAEAVSQGNLGMAYRSLGRYDEAIDNLSQVLASMRKMGKRRNEAMTLGNLGLAYHSLGRYDEAIEHHQKALEIAHEIGYREGEATALGGLGIDYYSLGRYKEAIEHHQKALEIAHEIGDRKNEANAHGGLGIDYYSLGRYKEAIEHHQKALEIAHEIGDRENEAISLGNLGAAYAGLERYDEAIAHYEQTRAIYQAIGALHLVELTERNIANAKAKRGG